ncbi:MAG: hypothetical protein KC731_30570 [Myxococcales bacterium]|nr:hypothetical protein [Myxococcales bacterium]
MSKVGVDEHLGEGDLSSLPKPPRLMRSVTVGVMLVTAAFALWLASSLWGEASFAFRAPHAEQVGILEQSDLGGKVGGFVRGYAHLSGKPSASYRRPFERSAFRVARASAAGKTPAVWVVYAVPAALDGPRFVPPQLVAGRLTRVGDLGVRFRGLASALADLEGGAAAEDYVLLDGETPDALGWVVGLVALLLAFVLFNVASVIRVLRPLPAPEGGGGASPPRED